MVANAGLVLLHPFLPAFLTRLGVLGAGADGVLRVASGADMARACRLVNSLAGDPIDVADPALGCAKLLCGVDPEVAVAPAVAEAGDRAVCDSLLAAVIGDWQSLGATSVAGLQESFLRRQGRLSRDAAGWRLDIEPCAFDMLIDRLPWTFAMIAYPWLPATIEVAWRTPATAA